VRNNGRFQRYNRLAFRNGGGNFGIDIQILVQHNDSPIFVYARRAKYTIILRGYRPLLRLYIITPGCFFVKFFEGVSVEKCRKTCVKKYFFKNSRFVAHMRATNRAFAPSYEKTHLYKSNGVMSIDE
jgi:hypothetical protein